MLESIESVLTAETEAEKLISDAKAAAAKERTDFSEIEATRIREAQAEADGTVRERLAAARTEQQHRVEEAEEQFRQAESSFADGSEERLAAAVNAATAMVVDVDGVVEEK